MEQWGVESSTFEKRKLMIMASIALGACGICSVHFLGMNALQLTVDDVMLEMYFEPVLTLLAVPTSVVIVFIGINIASRDPFYVNIRESRRSIITAKFLQENTAPNSTPALTPGPTTLTPTPVSLEEESIATTEPIREKMKVRYSHSYSEVILLFLVVHYHV